MTVTMNTNVFWDVTSRNYMNLLHNLNLEAEDSSETSSKFLLDYMESHPKTKYSSDVYVIKLFACFPYLRYANTFVATACFPCSPPQLNLDNQPP